MKNIIPFLLLLVTYSSYSQLGGDECSQMQPICTDYGLDFTANSGVAEASETDPGNNYSCLFTQPNPSWYYLEIATSGDILMNLSANSDIDFIIWGPFSSLSEAQSQCGNLGDPTSEIVDCSYSPTNNEFPEIIGAVAGEVYVMLITNYADVVQDVTLTQVGGTGTTDCGIVTAPPCSMSPLVVNVSGCDFATSTYSVSGTISYTDAPSTGNLIVEGCDGILYTIATAPFAAGPINFTIPNQNPNGLPCVIQAYFSADPLCTQSFNYTAPQCLSDCPTYDLQSTSPTVACGNQLYYLEVQNVGCDGYVSFEVVGNYGSIYADEITWEVVSNLTGLPVASGGPGTNGTSFNVVVGPLDPDLYGSIFNLIVYDNSFWCDGFNGSGGFIQVESLSGTVLAGPITGNFGCQANQYFQAGIIVSTSTITVNTPSGPVTSTIGNCQNHDVPLLLTNNNFCTPIQIDLPWTIVCDNSGSTIASGTHTVVVYPQVPDEASDVVSITWNTTTCEWDISPNNDCDLIDVGNLFAISPDPSTLGNYCANGTENFSVTYSGFASGPDCCSTAGPLTPITYSNDISVSDFSVASLYCGTNNGASGEIPGSGDGGNATSVDITISGSGYCYPDDPSGSGEYYVEVYVNGVQVLINGPIFTSSFNFTLTEADLAASGVTYTENSIIEVNVFPNTCFAGSIYSTYVPGVSCASLSDGQWTIGSLNVGVDAVYEQQTPSAVSCVLPLASSYTCCIINPLTADAPADVTVDCPSAVPAVNINSVTVTSSDCPTTVTHIGDVPSGPCPTSIARTYRVTDACGNFIDVVQTITINPPTVLMPSNGSTTVSCPSQASGHLVPTVLDNCGRTLSVSAPVISPDPLCEGTKTYTYTYSDCSGGTYTWIFTYTIDYSGGLTAPASASSTVSCPSEATDPGAPADILDACGRTVSAVLVGQDAATPTCEGTVVWRYRYTACDGTTTAEWTHTYTIDYSGGLTAPTSTSSTVSCPSEATDPGAPADILDACGRTVSGVLVGQDAATPACEGTVVWRYRYTACDGTTTADWTHTYTIDYSGGLTAPASASSTVSCPSEATDPGAPADILDACGRTVSAVLVGQDAATPACEGTVVWRYRYTACDGTTTADWTHTYTIVYSGGLTPPANASSTVLCPADATDPGAPSAILDACGRTVSAVLVGQDAATPACEGTVVWRYRYTACDGTTTADWTHTYTIVYSGGLTPPANASSTVLCPADATDPGAPSAILDACGRTVSAVLVGQDAATPTCEGTVVWRYRYTACDGTTTADWTHTYTIDLTTGPSEVDGPVASASVINCPSDAVAPATLPSIEDVCGNTLSPLAGSPIAGGTYVDCEGTITYTYNYQDCAGNPFEWTYTYTIDIPAFTISYADGSETVACPSDATDPGAPGVVTDACGNTLTPVVTAPTTVGCSGGTMDWVYTYTDCAGNTADWTYSYNVSLPAFTIAEPNGSSTVNCLADAQVEPTPPSVQDACGNPIVPTVVAPTDIACEGDMVWTFNYEDCGANTASWTYTYTIDIPAFTIAEPNGSSTVNCLADAQIEPTPPSVQDACGITLTPTVVAPSDVTCEGEMVWTFNYEDCANNTASWTYTYTIDIPAFTIAEPAGSSTVNCLVDAQVQPTAPTVQDACGNTLAPTVVAPSAIACEGDMVWTFNYEDCANNTASWTYTYTIDIPAFTIAEPVGSSTVNCLGDAQIQPTAPTVQDACGNTLTPTVVAPSAIACEGDMVWTFNYEDCANNTASWTYTYTIDIPVFTISYADGSETVACPSDATDPGAPGVVTDACGNTLTPVVTAPTTVGCSGGTMDWVYTYTDCAGNTADWTYSYNVSLPAFTIAEPNGSSTVNCLADAQVEPTPPSVQDACGNPIVPTVVAPTDIACEGDMVWTFNYEDCGANTASWTYTYTIDIPAFTIAEPNGSSTVNCLADAQIEPTPPSVQDACGITLTPTVVAPSDVTCEGEMEWIFNFEDCANNTASWTYTYTIDIPAFTITEPAGSSTVNCLVDAQVQPTAPTVQDACGNTLAPTVVAPSAIACEGDMVWTFNYEDCANNTASWTYTYTIDIPAFTIAEPVGSSTVNCLGDAQIQPTAPTVQDACGNTLTPTVVAPSAIACEGDMVWTFNYEDCANNTASWTYTYTIDIPVFTISYADGSETVACPSDATDPGAPGVVTDACGNTLTPVVTAPTTVGCSGGTMDWVYTYTDCAGNTADWTYSYNVSLPAFTIAEPNGSSTVNCLADAQVEPTPPSVQDACGNPIFPTVVAPTDIACEGDMVWTFNYEDCGANTASWTYTYTIDIPAFTIAEPNGSSTVNCLADAQIEPTPPSVQDACGITLTPTVVAPSDVTCEGEMVWTFNYEDCANNTASWTYTYTIDIPAFTIAEPAGSSTVNCLVDAQVQPTAPTVQDACGNTLAPTVVAPSAIACEGDMVWTFNYEDCANNTASWTYTYTIDIPAFTIAEPVGSSTVNCLGDAQIQPTAPTVQDACGNTLTPTVVAPSAIACEGDMVWTFNYEDCANNTASWTYTYTIDIPAFTISYADGSETVACPSDATDPGAPGVVTDACGNTLTPVVTAPTTVGCSGGTMDWVYTYTDCAGNTADWTYSYNVSLPAFTIAEPNGLSTVNCLADAQVEPTPPSVQDACGNPIVPTVVAPTDIACEGDMVWTFNYEDCANNTASWTYTYTIDIPAFTIAEPNGSSTVNCLADAQIEPTPPSVQDACGITLTPTVVAPSDVTCEGEMVWTFNYEDCANNTASWTYTYTIDIPAFTIAEPAGSSTVNCLVDAQVQPTAPTVQDACGNTLAPTVVAPSAIACEGDMVWTFNYEDCANNTASWTYTYTIDIPAFTIAEPVGSSTVNCLGDAQIQPTAPTVQDACGNTLTPTVVAPSAIACEGDMVWTFNYEDCANNTASWTYTYTIDIPAFTISYADGSETVACPSDATDPGAPGVVTDACGNTLTPVVTAPTTVGCSGGTMDWVYTYTDCAGNTADWTYSYNVSLPAFTIAEPNGLSTVNCLADAQVEPTPPSVQDACGNPIVPTVVAPTDIACEGDMVWTFNYEDCANNTASWTYTYTIDIPAFTIAEPNGSSTVNCLADAQIEPTPPSVQDACGITLTPTVVAPSDVTCEGEMEWIFNFEDCAGNVLSWKYKYIVDAASLSVPADITVPVSCIGEISTPTGTSITDACGNTIVPSMTEGADPVCSGLKIYTFTYENCAGETASCQYIFDVNDDLPPLAQAMDTIFLQANDPVPSSNIGLVQATDNCSSTPSVVFVSDVSDNQKCPETITRTYRVSDDCGNFVDVHQYIVINTGCEIVVPSAFTPNGDQMNDYWELVDIDDVYPNNKVFVYNRWGNLLFESEQGDYSSNKWDGKYNGELLPVASYYYIIMTEGDNSGEILKGTVSIIKK
jgi:gliding motility-associated-like protein